MFICLSDKYLAEKPKRKSSVWFFDQFYICFPKKVSWQNFLLFFNYCASISWEVKLFGARSSWTTSWISINYNSIPFRKSQTPPFYAIYTLAFLKLLLVDRATFWGEAGTKKSCKKKSAPRKIDLRKFCFIENVCLIVLFSLYEVNFWFRSN